MNPERLRILKRHKQWADRYLLIWLVLALALLSAFEFFLEWSGIGAAERAGIVALLGLLICFPRFGRRQALLSQGCT
jgi:hypothetical protein